MDEGKTSEDTTHTEAVNMISNAVKSDILTGEFMGLTHFGAMFYHFNGFQNI